MTARKNSVGQGKATDSNGEMGANDLKYTVATRSQTQGNSLQRNSEAHEAHSRSCTDFIDRDGDGGIDPDTFKQTVKRTNTLLRVSIWATKAFRTLTYALRWLLVALVIKALCFEYDAGVVFRGAIECAKGRNARSCTGLKEGFFPSSSISQSYQATFNLSDPNDVSEVPLVNVKLPIPVRNPIFLFVLLLIVLGMEYLLFLLHKLLLAMQMENARILNQALPEGPDPQIHRS